jgi:CheY-like chemotaxis protein
MSSIKDEMVEFGKLSILYVEDEVAIAEQMKKVFNRFCDDVTVAYNGIEAIDELSKRSFDLVVTDIHMPRMNGVELSRYIVANIPSQKLIVLTAYNQPEEIAAIEELGIKNILNKPVSMASLIEGVKKALTN